MKELIFFARDMHIGGLEKALTTLLNALDHSRFHVTLLLEKREGELLGELDERITVEEYSLSSCSFVPMRKLVNFSRRLLWRLKNGGKYDFSCSYCTYSVIGSRLMQYASDNACLYVHSDYFAPGRDSADADVLSLLNMSGFQKLVFVSQESMAHFTEHYPALAPACRVINNLTDCSGIREKSLAAVKDLPTGRPVYLSVGRLEQASKRLDRLIGAFARVHAELPDSRLVIIGDGKDRKLCRELIEKLALDDSVSLLGARTNPYPYMRACDCMVLSSDYEGFPMVYYEALTLGKKLVTTVSVSDGAINMAEHALICEKNESALAEAMLSFDRIPVPSVDIEAVNKIHLTQFYSLFDT